MSKPINADFKGLVDQALGRTKETVLPIAADGSLRRIPLIETIDLRLDSLGGDMIREGVLGQYRLKEPFVRVARLVVMHTWEAEDAAYEDFGDGAGTPSSLARGIQIYVNERPILPEPIQATKDYMKYAYDTDVVIDGVGVTKKTYFTSRFTFSKFMGWLEGIDLSSYNLRVECDITIAAVSEGVETFGNEFKWTFEGWGWDV